MRKLLMLTFLLCAVIVTSSCSDSDLPSTPAATRDYQTDAQILSKFVDVNKTIGEYYINENKKNSPLSYITNRDWEELALVSPVNRNRFERELGEINRSLEIASKRPDVTQIVYNTYGGNTWIRTLDHDAGFSIEKSLLGDASNPVTRSTWSILQLQHGALNEATFYAGPQIKSKISIDMLGYKMYFFEIACKTEATKTAEGGYPSGSGDNEKTIVMSGQGSMESYNFTWRAKNDDDNIFWQFKGTLHNPQGLGECIIKAEFTD